MKPNKIFNSFFFFLLLLHYYLLFNIILLHTASAINCCSPHTLTTPNGTMYLLFTHTPYPTHYFCCSTSYTYFLHTRPAHYLLFNIILLHTRPLLVVQHHTLTHSAITCFNIILLHTRPLLVVQHHTLTHSAITCCSTSYSYTLGHYLLFKTS